VDSNLALCGDSNGAFIGSQVWVVCKNQGIHFMADKFISLDELLTYLNCVEENDVVTVIIDDILDGKVYQYNNYNDKCWYVYGTTMGYA
jgi:hypothetical protein